MKKVFPFYKHHVQYYTEIEFAIEVWWYTPEIPFPYGSAGFGALSGLILQLERSHVNYVEDRLNLNPSLILDCCYYMVPLPVVFLS